MTHERTGARTTGVWTFLWTAGLLVMLLANTNELLASAGRIETLDHRAWGYSVDAKRAIRIAESGEIVGRLVAMVASLHLLVLLRRRDPRWPARTVGYGIAYLAFEVVVHALYLRFPPPAPESHFVAYRRFAAARAGVLVACLVYLARSNWARRTFIGRVVEPPAARPLLAVIGASLMAWPFLTMLATDTTEFVASLFSPLSTTNGGPGSLALIWLSVGYGMYLVLKHGIGLGRGWLLLVMPLGLFVLFIAYWAMSFSLHFGS